MPSLRELQEFKASFDDLGGQKAILRAKNIPFDDLKLPEAQPEPVEPPPPDPEGRSAPPSGNASSDPEGANQGALPPGDFDFGALTGTNPDALAPSPAEKPPETSPFYAPRELLSDLSRELDAAPPDAGIPDDFGAQAVPENQPSLEDQTGNENPAADSDPFADGFPGAGDADDFSFLEEAAGDPAGPSDPANGGEPAGNAPNLGDLDDFGLPEEATGDGESAGTVGDDLNLGDIDDFSLLEEAAGDGDSGGTASDDPNPGDLDDFGLPEEAAGDDDSAGTAGDDLNLGDLDDFGLPEEAASDSGTAGDDLNLGDLDDFSLPEEAAGDGDSAGTAGDDPNLGDIDDFSLPEEAAGDSDSARTAGDDLNLGDLDDFGSPEEAAGDSGSAGTAGGDPNFGDLDDFGLPEEAASDSGSAGTAGDDLNLGDLDDFGLPEEAAGDDLNLGDLDDSGFSGEAAGDGDSAGTAGDDLNPGDLDDFGLPEEAANDGGSAGTAGDDLNLGNLDDFGQPEEAAGDSESAGGDPNPGDLDDFGLPEAAAGDGESARTAGDDLNLGDLDDFGLPEEAVGDSGSAGTAGDDLNLGDLDDFGLPEELAGNGDSAGTAGDDLNLGDLDDFGLPEEAAGDGDSAGTAGDDLNLGDLDDFGLPEEATGDGGSAGTAGDDLNLGDLDDFGLPEEAAGDGDSAGTAGDDPNLGDLDDFGLLEEAASDSDSAGIAGDDPNLGDLDDFGLPEEATGDDDSAGTVGDDLNLGDLNDFGLPEEAANDGDSAGTAGDDLNLGDLDDFGLPEAAAGDGDSAGTVGDDPNPGDLDDFGLPEAAAGDGDSAGTAGDDMNPGDLDDFGLPEEPASDSDSAGTAGDDLNLGDLDDFGLPEEAANDGGSAGTAGDDLNLGDLDDFGLPEEAAGDGDSAGTAGDDPNLGELDDFGLPEEAANNGEPAGDDVNLGNTDDLGLPGLPDDAVDFDIPAELRAEGGADDFGILEDQAAAGTPEEDIQADGELPAGDDGGVPDSGGADGFDIPEDQAADFAVSDPGDGPPDSGPADPGTADDGLPDAGFADPGTADLPDSASDDSGEGAASGDGDAPENQAADEGFDLPDMTGSFTDDTFDDTDSLLDDFSFPDLDETLGRLSKGAGLAAGAAAVAEKKGAFGEPPKTLEDIRISEEELAYLKETLAAYPLNLRIACAEIITEGEASPVQVSRLIRNLVLGLPARETAKLAGEILDKRITVPASFRKSSGEELEAERSSFFYVFVHKFLPVFRLVAVIAVLAGALGFLSYRYIITPFRAETIYREGYERIFTGDFAGAKADFSRAFRIFPRKVWFYRYAEAFRDERQFDAAREKYEELLAFFPRDKKGVLDFAHLLTFYLRDYAAADQLLRRNLLDFDPNDRDALLAVGDNSLEWGEIEPERYEDARFAFARIIEMFGRTPPLMERMLRYFIRTGNLREVLAARQWFEADPVRRPMPAVAMSELGGYLLDRQLEEVRGVPDEFVERIGGVRDLLLRAAALDPSLPEPHYHLARFHGSLHNLDTHAERVTLENAIRAFDAAREESVRRLGFRIDAHRRYADVLVRDRELFAAGEQLVRGINLYDDAARRRLIPLSPGYGRLHAGLGDLDYFRQDGGDMEAALESYRIARAHGWEPPEMLYRMGAAAFRQEDWGTAMEYLFDAARDLPQNRRILYALGNAAVKRGNYFAAQGYYDRLLDILEDHRLRLPSLLPSDEPEYLELAERLLVARNNAGVAAEMLSAQTGNPAYRVRALSLYAEAGRALDSLTRTPAEMVRALQSETHLAQANLRMALNPEPGYEPQIFIRIDRDALEPSPWDTIVPHNPDFSGSDTFFTDEEEAGEEADAA